MLWFIIDGWNLANKIPSFKKHEIEHSSVIRFIKDKKLTGSRNNKVTIVFDGNRPYDLRETGFEIIFSGSITADDVIKNRVRREKKKNNIVVVSSDTEISSFIKKEGALAVKAEDFIKKYDKKKKQVYEKGDDKDIGFRLKESINSELRRLWLKEEE